VDDIFDVIRSGWRVGAKDLLRSAKPAQVARDLASRAGAFVVRRTRSFAVYATQDDRWWFGSDPATASLVSAGGSPGVNAGVAGDGTWTVVVLTNIDPPTGEWFAENSHGQLTR